MRTISLNGIDCEHEYSDWFVVKQPTQTQEGKQIRTCTLCGNTLTQTIPVLTESSSSQSSEEEVAGGCNGMITLPAIGIGLFTIPTAFLLKKRRKDD